MDSLRSLSEREIAEGFASMIEREKQTYEARIAELQSPPSAEREQSARSYLTQAEQLRDATACFRVGDMTPWPESDPENGRRSISAGELSYGAGFSVIVADWRSTGPTPDRSILVVVARPQDLPEGTESAWQLVAQVDAIDSLRPHLSKNATVLVVADTPELDDWVSIVSSHVVVGRRPGPPGMPASIGIVSLSSQISANALAAKLRIADAADVKAWRAEFESPKFAQDFQEAYGWLLEEDGLDAEAREAAFAQERDAKLSTLEDRPEISSYVIRSVANPLSTWKVLAPFAEAEHRAAMRATGKGEIPIRELTQLPLEELGDLDVEYVADLGVDVHSHRQAQLPAEWDAFLTRTFPTSQQETADQLWKQPVKRDPEGPMTLR